MNCDKTSYSKNEAFARRDAEYKKHPTLKLRVYRCEICHKMHLTSRVDNEPTRKRKGIILE